MARLLEERSILARPLATSAGDGFPFAIACLNVFFLLECHLRLSGAGRPPSYCPCCGVSVRAEYGPAQPFRGRHIRGFASLLVVDSDALFSAFAAAVVLCGRLWAASRFSTPDSGTLQRTNPLSAAAAAPQGGALDLRLLQFPHMLRSTKDVVIRCLAQAPISVDALTAAIGASFSEARGLQQRYHDAPGKR